MTKKFTVGVVGNPNCGKSTLFNTLTGSKQRVGNWPGVTVERKIGLYRYRDAEYELVDLPGTYSLDVESAEVSLDERIARDFVAEQQSDLILNLVDASNIERNLYLTAQLMEMRVPMIVVLNMMDVAKERGYLINAEALAQQLGCPVVAIVASTGVGVDQLMEAVADGVKHLPVPNAKITYPPAIEDAIGALMPATATLVQTHNYDHHWFSARLLEGDHIALRLAGDELSKAATAQREQVEQALDDDIDIGLADARYGFVNQLASACVNNAGAATRHMSDHIDRVVLNRVLGIPIFLLVMYLMFMFSINLGGAFIDFFDLATGALLVDGAHQLLTNIGLPGWLVVLISDGIGGGIQVIATFIPVIVFLYLFLSALEDSGYMARAAFVMDRSMRAIGLPGKAFVPLIVGFGCNVPAVMATRTMEHERDRLLTILMVPFMSCGARLPVYALFAAAFFSTGGQNVVFGLYLIGIFVAVITGFIMKNTLLQAKSSPFIMELPPYHLPTLKGVTLRTWERTFSFVGRAGKVILPMVVLLNVLNSVGVDGTYGNQDSSNSVLSVTGQALTPVFTPMGVEEDNWPATVGIFTGVLAKEVVVGSLDALYGDLAKEEQADSGEEEPFDLGAALGQAFASIPANLSDALSGWTDPLGLDVGDTSSVEAAADAQAVTTSTFGVMASHFGSTAAAFAYLLFILLYIPCVATLAAIVREVGMGWAVFNALWTTGMAYMSATLFYQIATVSEHPTSTAISVGICTAIITATIIGLRVVGKNRLGGEGLPANPNTAPNSSAVQTP